MKWSPPWQRTDEKKLKVKVYASVMVMEDRGLDESSFQGARLPSVTSRTKFLDPLTYLRNFCTFNKRMKAGLEKPNHSEMGSNVIDFTTPATELGSSLSYENQSYSASGSGFHSSKKRKLSFESPYLAPPLKAVAKEYSRELDYYSCEDSWVKGIITSRARKEKLRTDVFFATFDQRSEQASGPSACSVLAVVISHWLHTNGDLPKKSEFDSLIVEGSREWQRLCNNQAYFQAFPDLHFDLETVLEANICPLDICQEKSFVGFFSPEKFKNLTEAMSFDKIWDELAKNALVDDKPRIFIVSWNDHFFVLKMEKDAYYIIDTFGERLFPGCKQAYILKFDSSSVMYRNDDEAGASSGQVICTGKECCKEFFNRFYASTVVKGLEEEDDMGTLYQTDDMRTLYQRLQIEFHYSYWNPPSSLSSSTDSSTLSLYFSEDGI